MSSVSYQKEQYLPKSINFVSGVSQAEERVTVQKIQEVIKKETGKSFEWIEEVKYDPKRDTLNKTINKDLFSENNTRNSNFKNFMKDPKRGDSIQKFMLRKISEVVGYGVFARKEIFKDEVIGFYAGKMSFTSKKKEELGRNQYIFQIGVSPDPGTNEKDLSVVIDGEKWGNITRFINHCPESEDLDRFKFINEELKNSIQTANLLKEVVWYDNAAYIVFFAARNINAGEQLSYNYNDLDLFYSNPKFSLDLFASAGDCIDKNLYVLKSLTIEHFPENLIFDEKGSLQLYHIFKTGRVRWIDDPEGTRITVEMFLNALGRNYTSIQRVLYFGEDPCIVLTSPEKQ